MMFKKNKKSKRHSQSQQQKKLKPRSNNVTNYYKMASIHCPIECVRSACPDPDFLEKHSTFVLTITASLSATLGVVLSYILKSRCKRIQCCGLTCDREPIDLKVEDVTVQTEPAENREVASQ